MKKLVLSGVLLAFVVILLGAYTRLTDAGLGCPDWPGCYGHILVPTQTHDIAAANEAFPERPVETHKAWNEMIHRYFAGTLGFLILVIAAVALRNSSKPWPLKLPLFLLALVMFQGALGMWTVTLNLLPVVVMGHLLGGLSVLSCLFLLYLRLSRYYLTDEDIALRRLAKFAGIGIAVLVLQIALGGWTSANYAALACTQLPVCEGGWMARLDVAGAFSVPAAENYEYGAHSYEERMTMHVIHRFGAVITALYLGGLAIALLLKARTTLIKQLSIGLLAFLVLQVALGVSNVVFSLPLWVAVGHNGIAACLLIIMVTLTYSLARKV